MGNPLPYQNSRRDVDERVMDLLGRMTDTEKRCQLSCAPAGLLCGEDGFDHDLAINLLGSGTGQIAGLGGTADLAPQRRAEFANQLQKLLVEETRLGIPAIIHERAPLGWAAPGAEYCPRPLGLAATFNPDLVRELARSIRRELLAVGSRQALAPVLDVARDLRWDKLEESYGEDPYLAGRMGVAFIRGLQGEDLRQGVIATGRHFLGAGVVEGGVAHAPVHVGPRELREIFAEPFAAAIREAGLESVMAASNSVDGVPCAADAAMLDRLLRQELGFRGTVVSSYHGVVQLVEQHSVAAGKLGAAQLALRAGLDVELPEADCFGEPLESALTQGEIDVGLLDAAVARVLKQKFDLGLFESPYVDVEAVASAFAARQQGQIDKQLAEQSVVLVQNDGVLPLEAGVRIALFGSLAVEGQPWRCEVTHRAITRNVGQADDLSTAVATARAADVAVVCLDTGGAAEDARTEGSLARWQDDLVSALADSGLPLVVVVTGGRTCNLETVAARADALLYAWLPEGAAGQVVADVLFGEVNPSGRLPLSLAGSVDSTPVHYNRLAGRAGERAALYPFGHGLSYSRFEYDDLTCPDTVNTHGVVDISVAVRNLSERAGEEVVQLYLHDKTADVSRPVRQFAGFQRVFLEAGEIRSVVFQLDLSQLAYYNQKMEHVVDAGRVEILIGASSSDIRSSSILLVQGETRVLRQQQRLKTQSHVADVVQA